MPDFRVDDTAPEHPKLRAAGLAAAGLWAMAGGYSAREYTDGWVPDYWVATWPSGKRQAATLVKVGLWRAEARNGIAGYAFHDWLDYQRAAAKLKEDQRKARERMAAIRSGIPKQSTADSSSPDVRPNKSRTFARTGTERSDERAANVRDSLTLTHSGQVGGVPYGTPHAREEKPPPKAPTSENRPAERCDQHADLDGDPGPCRGCRDARIAAERWDSDAARRLTEQRSTEARQRAEARALAIANCQLCDDDGYRGRGLCTHDPDAAARAKRGRAAFDALRRKDPA